MPNIPTPIRAALGLAATAVDEARKLPETLPQVVSTVPLRAVSTAMQASLKLQQHLATLSARGDEVISQLRGNPAEPPSWATFDEAPADTAGADRQAGTADPQAGKAAFDRIDYDGTGFADSDGDGEDTRHRWDAVGMGGQSDADTAGLGAVATGDAPAPAASPDLAAPPAPVKAAKKAAPVKAPAKAAKPAKVAPAAPGKAAGAKAGPAKAKRSPRKAEPLDVAASKAKPSGTPTPSTMAAEILHAHEAGTGDE